MNGAFWFAVGGISTLALIWGSLELGRWLAMRRTGKRNKEFLDVSLKLSNELFKKLGELDRMIKAELSKGIGGTDGLNITTIFEKKTCQTCGQFFERGSRWLVFGKEYYFCFRCGLEGEIERFVKVEYTKTR